MLLRSVLAAAGGCLLTLSLAFAPDAFAPDAFAQDKGEPPPQQPIRAPQGLGIWLIGTHPMASDPSRQMVAHHFCQPLTDDLMQCVLYDGNQPDSRVTGLEYIIPQDRFERLPAEEQRYWHPHNFEILSGTLVAPEVADDMTLLAGKINSYGKTFHTWMTGTVVGEAEDFPYGPPMLAWSLNKEGQLAPELRQAYQEMGFNLDEIRQERAGYADQTNPQCGVNALDGQFPRETTSIDGVSAREDGCPEDPNAREE